MNRAGVILLIPAFSLFAGCENEIKYDYSYESQQLMVTGILSQVSKDHVVYVSLSSEGTVVGVSDATVKCYVNGKLESVSSAESHDRGKSTKYHQLPLSFSAHFESGDTVSLELEAEEGKYHAITRQQAVPFPPVIDNVDTIHTRTSHGGTAEEVMRFSVQLQDRAGEDNWYTLFIERSVSGLFAFEDGSPDNYVEIVTTPLISNPSLSDPVLLDGNMALANSNMDVVDFMDYLGDGSFAVFSDELFRDGKAMLKFDSAMQYYYGGMVDLEMLYNYVSGQGLEVIWPPKEVANKVRLRIQSCSREAYNYFRALRTVRSNGYNPAILEPIVIPDNIEGGIGFVGILSEGLPKL